MIAATGLMFLGVMWAIFAIKTELLYWFFVYAFLSSAAFAGMIWFIPVLC